MSAWEALFLGALQGATEFLPVSSSGHLVIGQRMLEIDVAGIVFEVAVHVATLLSVMLVFRVRITGLITGALRADRSTWHYLGMIALATVPAGLVGVFLREPVEALFETPMVVGFALLVTGAVLWSTRGRMLRGDRSQTDGDGGPGSDGEPPPLTGEIGIREALLIGVAQAFAIVPGISRSGTTVAVALWLGVRPAEAAAFSFLMAVPAIAGAAALQIPDLVQGTTGIAPSTLLMGFALALITGVAAIRAFMSTLRAGVFHLFGIYCWIVGLAFLLFLGVT